MGAAYWCQGRSLSHKRTRKIAVWRSACASHRLLRRMRLIISCLFVSLLAVLEVRCKNDWTIPCHLGACSFDIPSTQHSIGASLLLVSHIINISVWIGWVLTSAKERASIFYLRPHASFWMGDLGLLADLRSSRNTGYLHGKCHRLLSLIPRRSRRHSCPITPNGTPHIYFLQCFISYLCYLAVRNVALLPHCLHRDLRRPRSSVVVA